MNLKTLRLYLSDFLIFLKKPSRQTDESAPRISRGTRFWMAYVTQICIALVISAPLIYLIDRFLVRLNMNHGFASMHDLFVAIMLIVLLAPVMEELLFRYPLKFIKPRFLKPAVYISSIAFGLVHTSNYENNQWLFYLLTPIIVSSQSLGGFVLAYLRMREGVLWSMFAHALFNATMILLALLFYQGRMVINEKNERYTLTVKGYSFKVGKTRTQIYRSGGEHIDSIVWKQAPLQSLVDSLSSKPMKADPDLVDVEFKATHSIPADSLLAFLKKEFRIE